MFSKDKPDSEKLISVKNKKKCEWYAIIIPKISVNNLRFFKI